MFAAGEGSAKVDLYGSERHREVWNKTAEEMGVPLQWKKDTGQVHVIDQPIEELEIKPEDRAKFGLNGKASQNLSSLWGAVQDVSRNLELKRQQLLGESLKERKDVISYVDVSHLTEGESLLLERLAGDVVPLFGELWRLQTDPRLSEWRDLASQAALGGANPLGVKTWERRQDDACYPRVTDPRCSAFPFFPNKRSEFDGVTVWQTIPPDVSKEDIESAKKVWAGDPKRNPFFSPVTVVERDGNGGLKWTPFIEHPLTKEVTARLAHALVGVSTTSGIAESLAKELKLWGEGLRSGKPYPFDDAERTTVWQDEGNLEVTIDASPNYTIFGKNTFMIDVGVVRKGEADFVRKKVSPVLQKTENRLGALVPDYYKTRDLTSNTPVRFVDWVKRDTATKAMVPGEILAYKYPDGTKVAEDEGAAKRVVIINHMQLKFHHILKPLADVALVPEQAALVTQRAMDMNTIVHELSHGIGPQNGTTTKAGGTVDQQLGSMNHKIEEAKADTGGLSAMPFLQKNGAVSEDLKKEMYITWIAGLIRQMRFGGKQHGGAAAMSFGFMYEKGAVTVAELNTAKEGETPRMEKRFLVHPEKVGANMEELWTDLVKLQMEGDRAKAEAYEKANIDKAPDFLDELKGRFEGLGLPSDLQIHYRLVSENGKTTASR